jgi:hypothetical protein
MPTFNEQIFSNEQMIGAMSKILCSEEQIYQLIKKVQDRAKPKRLEQKKSWVKNKTNQG